ncbi:V-type proton ATPase 16 kDa proteolipid subunit [Tyrophagus putrescentiae]|nr:V-type proton ATPase 16 kDa proteolipid subunit [Tyrophagus putrescentiae]
MSDDGLSPVYAPFFGVLGTASAIVFSSLGAAYGTAKSGTGIAAMAVMRPELIMKSIIPVVMAGIIAIYGLVVAAIIANQLEEGGKKDGYKLFKGFLHLGAGLSVGSVRPGGRLRHRHKVLGLYGLIVALVLATKQ